MNSDDYYMKKALDEAEIAFEKKEVPVGAVVVKDEYIIGRGHNQKESLLDASAHAEIIAMTAAARTLKNWRLKGCKLYSTVEPCIMCAGAAVMFRIEEIVFGVEDEKFGGCVSLAEITKIEKLNHKIVLSGGVCREQAKDLMQRFFKEKRNNKSV